MSYGVKALTSVKSVTLLIKIDSDYHVGGYRAGQQQCFQGGGHPVSTGLSRSYSHHHHTPAPPRHTAPHGPHASSFRQWPGHSTVLFLLLKIYSLTGKHVIDILSQQLPLPLSLCWF